MAKILENLNTTIEALYAGLAAMDLTGGANGYSIDGQSVTFTSSAEIIAMIDTLEKKRALYEGDWDCDSVAI